VDGAPTILLAEDDDDLRDFLCGVLESSGFGVLEARTACEAVRLSDQHAGAVELLVTDVVPRLDGVELAARIRVTRPEIPVLLISAYDVERVLSGVVAKPPFEFLGKPFSPVELIGRVRALTSKRRGPDLGDWVVPRRAE
jgi:two-component system cell cycle sensor histidine kinase/response regulator CckA